MFWRCATLRVQQLKYLKVSHHGYNKKCLKNWKAIGSSQALIQGQGKEILCKSKIIVGIKVRVFLFAPIKISPVNHLGVKLFSYIRKKKTEA